MLTYINKYFKLSELEMDNKHHYIILIILALMSYPSFAKNCYPDHRALPKYTNNKNYLAFENFGHRGIGRCRGHAIVTQKMELLAKFNPKAQHICHGLDDESCSLQIHQKIKAVMSGKLVEINGFDSLFEFSKNPIAKEILIRKIINIPHRYQALDSSLENEDHPVPNINVFNEIVRRVSRNIRPYIAIKGANRISSHGLLAYKIIKDTKLTKVCVRDPNVVIENAPFENCQNFIYHSEDQIYYQQHGFNKDEKLILIGLKTDDDERTEQYINAHYESCIKRKAR